MIWNWHTFPSLGPFMGTVKLREGSLTALHNCLLDSDAGWLTRLGHRGRCLKVKSSAVQPCNPPLLCLVSRKPQPPATLIFQAGTIVSLLETVVWIQRIYLTIAALTLPTWAPWPGRGWCCAGRGCSAAASSARQSGAAPAPHPHCRGIRLVSNGQNCHFSPCSMRVDEIL